MSATMTNIITLKNIAEDGMPLETSFLPDCGMNMVSYKKGNIEIIDPSTRSQFEERYAGLGPLIGPHFHKRKSELIPATPSEEFFPHIARLKAKGGSYDPFSHGIARYAPWNYQLKENRVVAELKGSDTFLGLKLQELEGQNFTMTFTAELTPKGLDLELSVVSDTDSLVGIHYYYFLPKGSGRVISKTQRMYLENGRDQPIPKDWGYNAEDHLLSYELSRDTDFTFHPYPDPTKGEIILDTGNYRLRTLYECSSEENCWQLYHPKGASFVCIEPISSQDPKHPNLSVSSLKINLSILS